MAYPRPAEDRPYGIDPHGMTRVEYKEVLREHHDRIKRENFEAAWRVLKFVGNLALFVAAIWSAQTIARGLVHGAREECLRDVVACQIVVSQHAR